MYNKLLNIGRTDSMMMLYMYSPPGDPSAEPAGWGSARH